MEQIKHILLVDDDPFLRNFLGEDLAAHGYIVLSVENGLQALETIDSNQVDAVITDIFMPDMEGIELIQTLRKRFPSIPIFAMSGGVRHASSEDFLGFASKLGANEVFAKPVDLAMLVTKLEQHCRRGAGKFA